MTVTVDMVGRVDNEQLTEVLELVRAATLADSVAPLSEEVLLTARDSTLAPDSGSSHFLAYAGTHLAGYAHLDLGRAGGGGEAGGGDEAATAEVVVDPSRRRQGVGTALTRALDDALVSDSVPASQGGTLQIWSHGDLESARGFAAHGGYSTGRELWQMRRSLRPDAGSLPPADLPAGFGSRHFVVGQDEEAWLRVNARAFVSHPEQGRMTRHDLDRRIAEPWFDAVGLILVEDTRGPSPVLAASHWTKIAPADDPLVPPTEGEVYVVGVEPAYQGVGLGRAVTVLGLAHLRDKGMTAATLYVEGDNHAAVATYSRLDFVRFAVDIMYSRIVHPPM